MSCDAYTAAVDAHFLKRRYGIDSCSSEMNLDILDALNQIGRWKRLGGPFVQAPIVTNPLYSAAPKEIRYCEVNLPG